MIKIHMNRFSISRTVIFSLSLLASTVTAAELKNDISYLLRASVDGNPSLRSAWLDVAASGLDIEVAERARWPVVSAVVESKTGTVSAVPSRSLRAEQTLWDGGRLGFKVDEAGALKKIALYKYSVQQQQVFLSVVSAWQAMLAATDKKIAAEGALNRLRKYQDQMRRRVEAQASPQIDLELVDARFFQTEVELSSAKTAYLNALNRLEQITGLIRTSNNIEKADYYTPQFIETINRQIKVEDFDLLASEHVSVAKALAEVELAQHRYSIKNAERWPQIYVRVEQPMGQQSSVSVDTRMSTFLGMRYVPNAGFSNLIEAKSLATRVESAQEVAQASKRETKELFENDREDILSTTIKVKALERAVSGSALVLESYQRQFEGGRKSWLDLLNAVRELAQNEYALADAKTSLMASTYKFLVRAGRSVEKNQ